MKIDILTTDGSPLHICPQCVWGDDYRVGVGGSELFLMTLCEGWTKKGYKVRLYNDPHAQNDMFEQLELTRFNPDDDRDVLINFRTPNIRTTRSKGLKVWLSCDQYSHGNYAEFSKLVDKIVCISPNHVDFFKKAYGIETAIFIDIPVRGDDFLDKPKVKNQIIFTSVPGRGLNNLTRMFPKMVEAVPSISLVITSDYRLWGVTCQNEEYRRAWLKYRNNVQFLGAVSRRRYLDELSRSELLVYPCNYDELFCISVAEAQWAGAYPITSSAGALKTTNMGTVFDVEANNSNNDEKFINAVSHLLTHQDELELVMSVNREIARHRFSVDMILNEWEAKVFK